LPAVALGAGRSAVAVSSSGLHACALLDNGTVKCWGLNHAGQLGLGDTRNRGDDPGEMGDALPPVQLFGDPPDPRPTCIGQTVTVDLNLGEVPTEGPDVIEGTPGDDTINGLGGADVICGRDGNDTISGGLGKDAIMGGPGNDVLGGGDGADVLRGD